MADDTMISQLKEIQDKVYEIGKKIEAPKVLLTMHSQPVDDGTPYVTMSDGVFSYISSERGCEFSRKSDLSINDLIYLVFDRATSIMAMDYELNNRIEGQDSRRLYFLKRIELMTKLDCTWGYRTRQEINRTLLSSPFADR